ncbi:hypothetical protein TGRH88_021870 [Toxoplasma gondii]|uniref:Uncharacterized protein n=1 Tax=Toxoplasma gondii TaxID=5811 RepID=A0A7J6KH95_TOXGO|nr:hypothetical protein TGRH88_021870 [Toxoplasma gondii]
MKYQSASLLHDSILHQRLDSLLSSYNESKLSLDPTGSLSASQAKTYRRKERHSNRCFPLCRGESQKNSLGNCMGESRAL